MAKIDIHTANHIAGIQRASYGKQGGRIIIALSKDVQAPIKLHVCPDQNVGRLVLTYLWSTDGTSL